MKFNKKELEKLSISDLKAMKDQAEKRWDFLIEDGECNCATCKEKTDYWMAVFDECAKLIESRMEEIFGEAPSEDDIDIDDDFIELSSILN